MTPLGMRGKNLFTATVTVSSLLRFCLKIFFFFFHGGSDTLMMMMKIIMKGMVVMLYWWVG